MKISRKWLEQFVDLSGIPDQEFSSRLTMLGLEVESFENFSEKYKGFVVGHVLEAAKHPNADRLHLCKVDIGTETKDIICGAVNVAAGQKVPVALVGAIVPHDQHDPDGKEFELTRAKIRGVESDGMICSAFELGLGDDKNGIMVFEESAPTGKPLAEYLGLDDTVFEISLTPNRSDCLSHLGVAREAAAAFSKKLNPRRPRVHETDEPITAKVEVLARDLCPRYSARVVKGIKVEPSPRWLKDAVEKVGMRSINNVVDATNYVMLELGQPLHAFDLNLLKNHTIVVRRPSPSETTFTTLDGKERRITPDMLMICDKEKVVAVAGVMGGMNSEISDGTVDVLVESANFTSSSVRRTAKALGLSTEASYRFERGVDPDLTLTALDRVAAIIEETAGGQVAKGVVDVAVSKFLPRKIDLHVDQVNRLLGTRFASGEIRRLLDSIGIVSEKKSETILICSVPTFRIDIERDVDLVEEVGRVYGYEKIEEAWQTKLAFDSRFKNVDHTDDLKAFLAGGGFHEIVTNSLQPIEVASLGSENFVRIANPISEDMAAMRTSLLPGMLAAVRLNLSHGIRDIKLFETGRLYSRSDKAELVGKYLEKDMISLTITGLADPSSFDRESHLFDLLDLKTEVERVLKHLQLDNWDFIAYDSSRLFDQSLKLTLNGMEAGVAGRVSQDLLDKLSVSQRVFFAELNVSPYISGARETRRFKPLPKFPFASVDLSFIVNYDVPMGSLTDSIRKAAGDFFRDISIFDLYTGEGIPEGKKSVAFNVVIGSEDRTLDDEDISKLINETESHLGKEYSAILRKQKNR